MVVNSIGVTLSNAEEIQITPNLERAETINIKPAIESKHCGERKSFKKKGKLINAKREQNNKNCETLSSTTKPFNS